MRKIFISILFTLLTINSISAQMTVSGVLDSTVSLKAGAGDAPDFSYGFEEYANIRFQSKLREGGTVYGAVNLLAAAGDYAATAAMMANAENAGMNLSAYVAGENYIAGIELERLYFRLNGEYTDLDAGLFRLPFGYGQVWGPMDFLNPKNPLKPDARPRGILGASLSWYPNDDLKLLAFTAAGSNPFLQDGSGMVAGLSMDQHWSKASLQALYSYESPNEVSRISSAYGIHRAGLSLKADIEVGLVMDALYTYNHEAETKEDGLSFSIGADYSFFDGKLVVLAEYLYNGKTSSTAAGYGGGFSNNHYLYTGFTWLINDFTSLNAALISGFDDISFTPVISLSHDVFQGAVLTIAAQVPMDRDLFSGDGNRGELGPLPPDKLQPHEPDGTLIGRMGNYFNFSASLKIRF